MSESPPEGEARRRPRPRRDGLPADRCARVPGAPYPLGATWDGAGVNFALFSEHATGVELCLFDAATRADEIAPRAHARAHRPGLARLPARRAARRTSTASACTARTSRSAGHRFNPAKLLLDPYAKA